MSDGSEFQVCGAVTLQSVCHPSTLTHRQSKRLLLDDWMPVTLGAAIKFSAFHISRHLTNASVREITGVLQFRYLSGRAGTSIWTLCMG